MDITTEDLNLSDFMNTLESPAHREGHHVTDLIDVALASVGKGYGDSEPNYNLMALGRMWEKVCAQWMYEWNGMFTGPISIFKDGIVGSLDGSIDSEIAGIFLRSLKTEVVVEMKLTFSSAPPEDRFRWMAQVKAYCHMAGTNQCWMPVLYLSGRPPDARFKMHKLTFSQRELDENWQMILHAKEKKEKANV